MGEVASSYVSLMFSAKGAKSKIKDEIGPEVDGAGKEAGERFSGKLKSSLGAGLKVGMAAAGGLAIGAFASAFGQYQSSGSLQAKLGIGPDEAAKLSKTAGSIYAQNWGESLGDVTDSISAVKQGLGNLVSDNQIQGLTTKALAFNQTFGTETPEVVNAVAQMLRTGLAKNADQAFDVLTTGFQNGSNKADDLLDTFNEYGTQFRKLGLDGPKALGLLSQGLKGGARDSDLVADSLKEFSIRAVDGSTTTAAGFKALGLNAKTMAATIGKGGASAAGGLQLTLDKLRGIQDPVKRAQAAVNLFGTQSEDLGKALFDLNPATASAANGMKGLKGSTDRMSTAIGNTASPLEVIKRQAMGFVTTLASRLVPIMQKVQPLLAKLGPIMNEVAPAFLAGAAALAVITGATAAWNAVLAINPVTLIIVGLAALAAGLVIAYKKSETFRRIVQTAFAVVKTVASDVANFFVRTLPNAFNAVVGGIRTAFTNVVNFLKTWGPVALAVLFPFLGIPLLIFQHFDQIKTFITTAFNNAVGFLVSIPGRIIGFFAAAGTWLLSAGHAIMTGLWKAIKAGFNAYIGFIGTIRGRIGAFFAAAPGWLLSAGRAIMTGLWNAIKAAFFTYVGFISTIRGRIGAFFSAAPGWLTSAGRAIMSGLWNAIRNGFESAIGFLSTIKGRVVGFFGDAGSWLLHVGGNVVEGLFNGIKSALSGVGGFVSNIASDIGNGVKNALNNFLNLPIRIPRIDTHIPGVGAVGGQTLIPRLARGGLTNGPMMAMVGDNPSGNELVAPLDSPKTVMLLSDAMRKAGLGSGTAAGGDTYNVYESTNARQVALEISRQKRMAGRV